MMTSACSPGGRQQKLLSLDADGQSQPVGAWGDTSGPRSAQPPTWVLPRDHWPCLGAARGQAGPAWNLPGMGKASQPVSLMEPFNLSKSQENQLLIQHIQTLVVN